MYKKLTPNALKCMYIATAVGTIIALIVAATLEIAWLKPNGWMIPQIILLIVSVGLILDCIISPWFRFNRYKYKIDNEAIDIVEGYLFVKRNIVPIERLHKLEINRGPIDKLCKVAKVKVTTAGGDVVIRFLDEDNANKIVDSLKIKINDIAIEEKRDDNN